MGGDPLDLVLSKLGPRKPSGKGFLARCPAHEDRRESLSITRGDDGKALLKCHAGCSVEAICAALGLHMRDLFANDGRAMNDTRPRAAKRDPVSPSAKRGGKIVDTYPYPDENGVLLYEVVRLEPKGFRQRRPDGKGKWIWNLDGVRRVPYHLPELLAKPKRAAFVVEGEKDVESLERLGLLATTNPGGAGKWGKLDPAAVETAFRGRPVVILPDHDEPGRKHARDVARRLLPIAGSIRILELPGNGKDVSNWIEAGGTAEELKKLAKDAVKLTGPPEEPGGTEKPGSPNDEGGASMPDIEQARAAVAAALKKAIDGDPGAPFEPDALAALRVLRREVPAEYERARPELRKAKVRIGALDEALSVKPDPEVSEAPPSALCSETTILDSAPEMIRRPLTLISGTAYAAAWLHFKTEVKETFDERTGQTTRHDPPLIKNSRRLVVVRDDGKCYSDAPMPGAHPLGDLGLEVQLREAVPDAQGWSGAGVQRYLAGERPDVAEVFRRIVTVVNYFMDFDCSLAPQETMCELIACYDFASYLLDAFHVTGYLWPNGEAGSGKTNLLYVVTGVAYLGQTVLAGGTFATLRDLADYGATIAFDDAEAIMDSKKADPDKRTLLLAGNRRGSTVPLKESVGEQWVTRYVNTFCPRLFSAIRLPDPVLGSRSIVVPLVRSNDKERTDRDPQAHETWPHDRRRLVDDLWAAGLANLPNIGPYWDRAAKGSRLSGRNLEPWRAVLTVALFLEEEHGLKGLFTRLEQLSVEYQRRRPGLEQDDLTRLLILAVDELGKVRGTNPIPFTAGEIAERVNAMALEEGLSRGREEDAVGRSDDQEKAPGFTTEERVGRRFAKLGRFQRGPRTGKKRLWTITKAHLAALLETHGLSPAPPQDATVIPSPTVTPSPSGPESGDRMTVSDSSDSKFEGVAPSARASPRGSKEDGDVAPSQVPRPTPDGARPEPSEAAAGPAKGRKRVRV